VAHTLKRLLESPVSVGGRSMQVGASIGLAMFPDDAQTPESLSILADERMYTAKRNGGGSVQAG
jgi:GGDEF domain-containing protein